MTVGSVRVPSYHIGNDRLWKQTEDLLEKFEATMVRAPVVYLKMNYNTWWKLADSLSEGTFQLSDTIR